MGFIRPATPGFLVTLTATVLLAVVSFCVPYFKSVYFLKANVSVGDIKGSVTFGTLGYCLQLPNGTSCSTPTVGYQLDITSLVGSRIEIPQVVVKWLTYALVLHIVALGLAGISAIFGLLAHVREMSMACCSSCISGFAATVALVAFIFDIALFFVAKARINAIGSAEIGNAVWLTLAAWILLFFSGCFYTIGRCCIRKRKTRGNWGKDDSESNQMRLDTVKADADKKARQKEEVGLPAFSEEQPLVARIDGRNVYIDNPEDESHGTHSDRPSHGAYPAGGYAQAPIGSRAVDEYYSPTRTEQSGSTYPPAASGAYTQAPPQHPRRQTSNYAPSHYSASHYAPSTYANNIPTSMNSTPSNQYLSAEHQNHGGDRYGQPSHDYGHTAGGSSYHTAASHDRQNTGYAQYDPFDSQPQRYTAGQFYHSGYTNTPNTSMPGPDYTSNANPSYYPAQLSNPHPERSYSLGGTNYGGNGYGENSVPPLPELSNPYTSPQREVPPPINTHATYTSPPPQTSPVKGPRPQPQLSVQNEFDDQPPPMYDAGSSNVQGAWGKH